MPVRAPSSSASGTASSPSIPAPAWLAPAPKSPSTSANAGSVRSRPRCHVLHTGCIVTFTEAVQIRPLSCYQDLTTTTHP